MPPTHSQYHAVVLGGSMAGLLAARVLSNHFDHVTHVPHRRRSLGGLHGRLDGGAGEKASQPSLGTPQVANEPA